MFSVSNLALAMFQVLLPTLKFWSSLSLSLSPSHDIYDPVVEVDNILSISLRQVLAIQLGFEKYSM
jgi:hypothetical protein